MTSRRVAIFLLLTLAAAAVLSGLAGSKAAAADRFPPPDFKDPHPIPSPTAPQPRSDDAEALDVAILLVALLAASALVLLLRVRIAIFILMIGAALLYFGFYRKGCVCPIGSVQNVSMAVGGRQAYLSIDHARAEAAGLDAEGLNKALRAQADRFKGSQVLDAGGTVVRVRLNGENKRILREVEREVLGSDLRKQGPSQPATAAPAKGTGTFSNGENEPVPVSSLTLGDVLHVERAYSIPWVVVGFFALPLLATLFFGRTFCGAVCPLGAIQDVMLIKAVRVPRPVEHALGLLPYVYLGAAVMFAAVGSAFVICRYDPFVGFFRLSAAWTMLVLGGSLLVVAMFVGRPYCRYLCPYGAVLRHASMLSWRHATITPDVCIHCRLCEDVCPYGAINPPADKPEGRKAGKWVLAGLLVLLPLLIVAGGLLGRWAAPAVARVDPLIRQAERVHLERDGLAEGTTDASDAFRQTGRRAEKLFEEAAIVQADYRVGAAAFGAFLGLVVGVKLVSLSIRRRRVDYETDRAKCVSCGRCFAACPRERVRRKRIMGKPTEPGQ